MAAENEKLKLSDRDGLANRSLWRRLLVGTGWTTGTAIALAVLLCLVARHAPLVTTQWFLSALWGFAITWILLTVMYRAADMAGMTCVAVVVVHVIAIAAAKSFVLKSGDTHLMEQVARLRPHMALHALTGFDVTFCVGVIGAIVVCRDGSSLRIPVIHALTRQRRW